MPSRRGCAGAGAKAIAVDVWRVGTGVSLWEGPVVLGALLSFWYALSARDGWTVFVSTLCFVVYLALRGVEGWLGIGLGCWTVLTVKHYSELRQGWAWRPLGAEVCIIATDRRVGVRRIFAFVLGSCLRGCLSRDCGKF
jgi:hypothetical protein